MSKISSSKENFRICLKLRKSSSCVSVKLNFVKIYALKALGIKPCREAKRLETGLGKFSKTFMSGIKDSKFLNIQKLGFEEKKS